MDANWSELYARNDIILFRLCDRAQNYARLQADNQVDTIYENTYIYELYQYLYIYIFVSLHFEKLEVRYR